MSSFISLVPEFSQKEFHEEFGGLHQKDGKMDAREHPETEDQKLYGFFPI